MSILDTGEKFAAGTFNVYSRTLTDGSEVFDVYQAIDDTHDTTLQRFIVAAASEGRAYHAASLFEQAYKVAQGEQ